MRRIDAVLERTPVGLSLALSGTAELASAAVPFRAEGVYASDGAVVTIHLDGLSPAILAAELTPRVGALVARVEVPLRGSVSVALDDALRPRRVRLDAGGGPGRLAAPEVPAREIALEELRIAAAFDVVSGTLDVDEARFRLRRGEVRVRGAVDGAGGVDVEATASLVPVEMLRDSWPDTVVPSLRAWFASRVDGGVVRSASVRLGGRIAPGEGFAIDAANGTLWFDGLAVRYRDDLPPARALAGKATFTRGAWRLRVARGGVAGLEVVRAAVSFTGLDGGLPRGAVDATLRGPLAEGLALARAHPLGGRLPAGAAGVLAARLRLEFPLRRAPALHDIHPVLSAEMRNVAVADVFRGWSVTDGNLTRGPEVVPW